tara:strand:- start:818 stop:931 length:114 start_codon:yes stop_codon:yes gene_type:complete
MADLSAIFSHFGGFISWLAEQSRKWREKNSGKNVSDQ